MKPTHHFGKQQDSNVRSKAESLAAVLGRKPLRRFQYANAVGTLEESNDLGHALETWSDATAQYWTSSGRVDQLTLSGKFDKFRMKPVLGETFMPLECVILEGGGNAELRAWKAFGQHHSQSSPCDRPSRARTVRCKEDRQFHPKAVTHSA